MKSSVRKFLSVAGISLVAGGAGLMLSLVSGPVSAGTIVGSAHDFSTSPFAGGEICVLCHTPHNADTTVTDAPLWNHAVTVATFTMYASPSLDATMDAQPAASSKLCLSCHDGTIAVDSFGGATGSNFITGGENLGTNLADDHPISFTYDTALATLDGGLHDPAATSVTTGSGADVRTGLISDVMLIGGQLQCASCHDVHNVYTAGGGPLLRISNAGSGLCLACHDK